MTDLSLCFKTIFNKLGIVWPETKEPDWTVPPHYIEVPPNVEAKQIILYVSTVLSC